ncbi:MAG: hypothetical protein GTO41_24690, partial [Burkholderiales bacterium]|nr:hypothetical protein [Burkholderiales bacterium]
MAGASVRAPSKVGNVIGMGITAVTSGFMAEPTAMYANIATIGIGRNDIAMANTGTGGTAMGGTGTGGTAMGATGTGGA